MTTSSTAPEVPLRFDGRVAIVTGAGRGIGRAYAELLAARGARVVVNDLGTAMDGGGRNTALAHEVVDAIRSTGGTAVADTNDVTDPDGPLRMAHRAIAEYGGIDIVVNNAGSFGTDEFPTVDPAQVERLLAVHVMGSLAVARACWPHLRNSGSGRMVMTTSTGALGRYDMIGYGTAKAGVWGLTRGLASAGVAHGIRVNAVAPLAMTRMMAFEQLHGEDPPLDPARAPSLVAPLVAVLCHESCPVNGEAFVSGQRRTTRLVIAETDGYLHRDLDLTPEAIATNWAQVMDTSTLSVRPDTVSWSAANARRIAGS